MSFVKLKKRFFVNNTIRSKNNIFYKESDPTTWAYDNYLNSKNVIEAINSSNINKFDINSESLLAEVKEFFDKLETAESDIDSNGPVSYKDIKNELFNQFKARLTAPLGDATLHNLIKDNILSYKYRNHFKASKLRAKFLVDDQYVYKKNAIKSMLYDYYNSKNNEYYKDLEKGYCNYNTINFFSLDTRHKNSIIYANPYDISENKYLYDISGKDLTISFKTIFRNLSKLDQPNCLLHIPGVINIYFIKSNNNTVRIAVTTSNKTYKNILSITEFSNRVLPGDPNADGDFSFSGGIIQGNTNALIKEKTWYNVSVKFDTSKSKLYVYIDDTLVLKSTLPEVTIGALNNQNSFIQIGNKFNYSTPENASYDFVFNTLFSKDETLGVDTSEKYSLINKDIHVPISFQNSININSIVESNFETISGSESFNGEVSDIRIYNTCLRESEIVTHKTSSIKSLKESSDAGLEFFVPVYYIPLNIKEKQYINASGTKTNLSYTCNYNLALANTCGGLDLNNTNYLVELIKSSKPNVIINGSSPENLYANNHLSNISTIVNSTNSFADFKKGRRLFETYNDKINELSEIPDNNLYYKNLMILPNDNGIPEIDFQVINEFIENRNTIQYNTSYFSEKPYNVSIENIVDNTSFILDKTKYKTIPQSDSNLGSITFTNDNDQQAQLEVKAGELFLDTFSNILFHNKLIVDYNTLSGSIKSLYNKSKTSYNLTESNPSIRNIFADDINLVITKELFEGIRYFKIPLPYSDINKDLDSSFISIIDISNKIYNNKIIRNNFELKDNNFKTGNSLTLKDNGLGGVYRSDCNSKVADWNYVGHVFYKDGIVCINNPVLSYFSEDENSDFEINMKAESFVHVKEINVPADSGIVNNSQNLSHNSELRHNEAAFNSEESFVYITDINLHDENFNIVSRAKLARPIPKKDSDKMIFKLKMDY